MQSDDDMVNAAEQWLHDNPPLTNAARRAEIARLTSQLRAAEADLRRYFKGETHAVRNEREKALRERMRSIMQHFDCYPGSAPGHAHDVPGVWDNDISNGAKGGTQCAWCAEWAAMEAALKEQPHADA